MYKNKKKSNISKRIIIVGNPNCGKSTIFNSLTGFQQKVGNWSGVTVDEKVGTYLKDDKIEIIDLPGLYSLTTTEFDSLDEQNASCIILKQDFDLIIHVIDVSHINTTLYLTIHLLEMGLPMIIVLNMVHLIEESELKLIQEKLALRFKCPIIGINAKIKSDVEKLDIYITSQPIHPEFNLLEIHKNTPVVLECISEMRAYFQSTDNPEWHAIYNMEVTEPNFLILDVLQKYQKKSEALYNEGIDVILLNNRCQYIENVNSEINIKRPWQKLNDTLDVIFLNKFLSFPILLMFMYLAFSFSILIGGAFQEFFELTTQAILIDGLADCLKTLSAPLWVIELFAYGIGGGIQTVATFIPVIAGLYIFLSFLEESGYMTRAAIVADRLMQVIGLPGKAFVPLIIGFGCNVPAIMAARTLDNKTERLATILITPFMSCSARFSVFSLFAAAFFPSNGHNIIFLLYLVGILAALLTGYILKSAFSRYYGSYFFMEMPNYKLPRIKDILISTYVKLKEFVFGAGKMIIILFIILHFANNVKIMNSETNQSEALISVAAKKASIIFAPIGISEDNWPATLSIFTGILAKEVVIGTLQASYNLEREEERECSIKKAIIEAFATIPNNLISALKSFANPNFFGINTHSDSVDTLDTDKNLINKLVNHFNGAGGAFAYLLFILLYFPCISVFAVITKEVGFLPASLSIVWSTMLAYSVSSLFYQFYEYISYGKHINTIILLLMPSITIIFYFSVKYLEPHMTNKLIIRTNDSLRDKKIHTKTS